jgi:hypothetical protein
VDLPVTRKTPISPEIRKDLQAESAKGIFLSHAHADRAIADLLRNTLVLGGIPEQRIFYSSSRATGIPSGEDVRSYLRESLRAAGLVIELVSAAFLARPMCLMELGGAWTLGTPTYPIVLPPLTRDLAVQNIGNVQMGVIGTEGDVDDLFDELHDRLAKNVEILTDTTPWNRAIRSFKLQMDSMLAAASSAPTPRVSPERDVVSARRSAQIPARRTAVLTGEEITVSNVSLGSEELYGEATNVDDVQHTVYINAVFYDAEGRIVGTRSAIVSQLRPGATKTFSIDDIPDHHSHKVEINMVTS